MLNDRRAILIALAAALAALVFVGRLLAPGQASAPADLAPLVSVRAGPTGTGAGAPAGPVLVHVVGAVRHPGVFRLPSGSRVRDAVRAAGGARQGAQLAAVNLAQRLADGEQVALPGRGVTLPAVAAGAGSGAVVHLGSATVEQLDALDGIGPALAARIVAYREQHGGFRSVDELADVPGIGPTRLEALRAHVAP